MRRILIIDDEDEILSLLNYLFTQLNFEVVISPGVLSIDEIEKISPNVILLDNKLGDKLGSDLCLEIKGDPRTSAIPVVMLSANDRIEYIAEKSCADGFISKPFDIEKLNKTVKKVMVKKVSNNKV